MTFPFYFHFHFNFEVSSAKILRKIPRKMGNMEKADLIIIFFLIPCKKCDRDFLMSFWRQFVIENETKSDGIPIIFLENAMEIPWLEVVQNPCHVSSMENK